METRSIVVMNWRDIRHPDAGGAEVVTHELAKRWTAWGHEVTLITSSFPGSQAEQTIDGVRVLRGGTRYSVYSYAKHTYLERFRDRDLVLVDEINTRPFFAPRYAGPMASVFAFIHQLAREFWFYETRFPVNVLGRFWLEDSWLRRYRAHPIITVSKSTADDLRAIGCRDIRVIPEGRSVPVLDGVPPKEARPTLIYVNRMRSAKLPGDALAAFGLVRRALPNARLWMVGDGYLRPALERDAPEGVRFFGRVSEEDKYDLLRRAHLLLYPGVREGWGLTVIDANAVGTPVVAYDVPGLRDSVRHQTTGLLASAGQPSAMAQAAIHLLQNSAEYLRLATNALEWARSFDWDASARKMLAYMDGPAAGVSA